MKRPIAALLLGALGVSAVAAQDATGTASRLPLSDWVGQWVASEEHTITITQPDKKTLVIDGYATYGALDPDRVERGAVNMGEFFVQVPGRWVEEDNALAFAVGSEGEAVPADEADEYDCVVSMRLADGRIDVTDNLMCGGMNVSFTGEYEPKPQGD